MHVATCLSHHICLKPVLVYVVTMKTLCGKLRLFLFNDDDDVTANNLYMLLMLLFCK